MDAKPDVIRIYKDKAAGMKGCALDWLRRLPFVEVPATEKKIVQRLKTEVAVAAASFAGLANVKNGYPFGKEISEAMMILRINDIHDKCENTRIQLAGVTETLMRLLVETEIALAMAECGHTKFSASDIAERRHIRDGIKNTLAFMMCNGGMLSDMLEGICCGTGNAHAQDGQ